MGAPQPFKPEKLVIGVLAGREGHPARLYQRLENVFGALDYRSKPLEFSFTHYYDGELGTPIKRIFLSFERLFPPEKLAYAKLETNRIEDEFREGGKRKVNLDPGLLSLSRFILATTKEGSHRIPLRSGIFAEVTLVFENKHYRSLEWTYPDYRSGAYRDILDEIRSIYKDQVAGI